MFKTISKVALCVLLLGGSAKAWEYKDASNNIFKINGTADFYLKYQSDNHVIRTGEHGIEGETNPARPFSTGKVRFDTSYSKIFSDTLSISAITRLDLVGLPDAALDLKRAYLEVNHTKLGTLKLGRYEGFAGIIQDMSDVDVLVDTPAVSPLALGAVILDKQPMLGDNVYGGATETGAEYSISFLHNALLVVANGNIFNDDKGVVGFPTVGLLGDDGKKLEQVFFSKPFTVYNDYRFGLGAMYKINIADLGLTRLGLTKFNVGAVTFAANYNFTGVTFKSVNGIKGEPIMVGRGHGLFKDGVNYLSFGGAYDYKTFHIGVTGNTRWFKPAKDMELYKTEAADITKFIASGNAKYEIFAAGVEVGAKMGLANVYNADGSLAFSRIIPAVQYDYSFVENDFTDITAAKNVATADKASVVDQEKSRYIASNSLELSLSYYVTPSFHYVVAGALDLRTQDQVQAANRYISHVASESNNKRSYVGVGAVYNF